MPLTSGSVEAPTACCTSMLTWVGVAKDPRGGLYDRRHAEWFCRVRRILVVR